MGRETYQGQVEQGTGGDPKPTAGHHFKTVVEEVRISLQSPSTWDRKLHEEKARIAAIALVRVANSHALTQLGRVLISGVVDHPETLPVVMGTYKAIRDGFYLERAIKAVDVRRLMGLPTRGRVFPRS